MIRDMWESFTWAIRTCIVWVKELIGTLWETSPLTVLGVVFTIVVAFVVTFRHVN